MAENNQVGGVTSRRQRGSSFSSGLAAATDQNAGPRANIPQGLPGATGPAGPTGPMGPMGDPGTPGINGRSVVSITDEEVTRNGVDGNELTITLSGTGAQPAPVFLPFGTQGNAGRGIVDIVQNPANPAVGMPSTLTISFTEGPDEVVNLPAGATGLQGPQAMFGTPTVTDVAAGGNATATISGAGSTADPYILALGIPEGEQGEQAMFGPPVALPVPAGRPAAVNITGNGSQVNPYILNFSIPDGAAGAQGPQAMFGQPTIATGPESIVITGTGSTADPYILRLVLPIDTDTTYTFAGGTGGSYTVTPSDTATAQTVETLSTGEQAVVAANPFLDDERIKLAAARIQNIIAAAPASDGSITYTAEVVDAMGRADPGNNVTWTTGGGGANPTPVERFQASINPTDVTQVAGGVASATITLGVTGTGFNYTGYRNLSIPAGIPTAGIDLASNSRTITFTGIPIGTPQRYTFDVDILSTGPDGPVAAHPVEVTLDVNQPEPATPFIFYEYVPSSSRNQTVDFGDSTPTPALAQAGNSFTIPGAPNANTRDLVIAWPTAANVHLVLFGRVTGDENNVTITGVPMRTIGYTGIRLYDRDLATTTPTTTYNVSAGA